MWIKTHPASAVHSTVNMNSFICMDYLRAAEFDIFTIHKSPALIIFTISVDRTQRMVTTSDRVTIGQVQHTPGWAVARFFFPHVSFIPWTVR